MSPPTRRFAGVGHVAEREFQTVIRTPAYWLLAVGAVAVVGGLTLLGGTSGYLPLVLDLLWPLEVLVPLLAFAFGYRAILGDRERGELDTIRTYPISRYRFATGVFLGRAVALLAVVVLTLAVAGAVVASSDPNRVERIAAHGTADTPLLLARLVGIVALYALAALGAAIAASAAAGSARTGLVMGTLSVAVIVVGLDGVLVAGVATGVLPVHLVTPLSALSPTSAFRGLVFSLVVSPAGAIDVPVGPGVGLAVAGLLGWLIAGVAVAALLAWAE